jgi:hypothetical protein
MATIVEKGTVETDPRDQISFTLKSLEFDSKLIITTKSGEKKVINLPENYRIEQNDGQYTVIFNKHDDYKDSFGIMIYPVFNEANTGNLVVVDAAPQSDKPIQATQSHPSPKFQISYAGQEPLWGRIFNINDLE